MRPESTPRRSIGGILWRRRGFALAAIVYALVIGAAARSAWLDRDWNFDALGYVGVALSGTIHDPEELHQATYAALERGLPAPAFKSITSDSVYRKALHERPEAFGTQLVFYRNKPLYTEAVAALHHLGMNAARATRALSVASYVALGLVLLVGLWLARAGGAHVLTAAVLMIAPPMTELAQLSTPDATGLLPLACGAVLLQLGRPRSALMALGVAVLVRPDLGMSVVLLLIWLTFAAPESMRPSYRAGAALVVGTLLLGFFLQKLAGGASLPVVWRHSFEARLYEPARMHETISAAGYWRAFVKELSGAGLYHPSVMFLHLSIAAMASLFVYAIGPAGRRRSFFGWQLAAWAYVPLHYVLIPDRTDRYFAPAYVLSFVAALFATTRPAGDGAEVVSE